MFAKAVLPSPIRGGKKKRYVVNSILSTCLRQWQVRDLVLLWEEVRRNANQQIKANKSVPLSHINTQRALFLAKEGCYCDAMCSLNSQGCASHEDSQALDKLWQRHLAYHLLD